MATTKLYLDARAVGRGEPAPLKVSITKHGVAAYIPLHIKILPSQWDKVHCRVIDNPNKTSMNAYIQSMKQKIDNLLMRLTIDGRLTKLTSVQIKNLLLEELSPESEKSSTFMFRFKAYMNSRRKQRTKEIYHETYKRILQYDKKAESLTFEKINKDWLTGFDNFLIEYEPSQNTRSIHFRNIRAIFNDAIDNDITDFYPFRKFMVRPVPTVKRAFTVEKMRELFNYPVLPHEQKYLDMFKLIFYLIGINIVDLCNLTEIQNGRIIYQRSKTSRLYNIKVEPEALEIIERYRGKEKLLNVADKFKNVHSYTCSLNRALKQIGPRSKDEKGHVVYNPAFPELSSYVARHTWATLADELEIPRETIARALGHSYGNKTTAIYIKADYKKVDEANRRIIDYVLGKDKS